MSNQPTLETSRLLLRRLEVSDCLSIQAQAGDIRVAEMTENIPHPYEEGMAEDWIENMHVGWEKLSHATFAVCLNEESGLIGCCGLVMNMKHRRATLGYWIGVENWGNGYCTEAATAVVKFGFDEMKLHRIEATHLTCNPVSGAVMRKVGMKHEATKRDYVLKNGEYEDTELYFLLEMR